MAERWQIRVDVGGTFTDCIAIDPGGLLHVAKVLSTGALRATIQESKGQEIKLAGEDWSRRLPAVLGGRVESCGEFVGLITRTDSKSEMLVVDSDTSALRPGQPVELSTGEPAPILAARIVTGTPAGQKLPDCEFRLATTRATNALLERRFARAALLVSEGFSDVLRIGDQRRPDVYALNVSKPPTITELTFGVPGRLGPDGQVVVELDDDAVREAIGQARLGGAETIAIALINSWVDPSQEIRCEELCREAGFEIVERSSAVSPRIGLWHRAQTTAIESALVPVLNAYIKRIEAPLPSSTFNVLGSDGGLTPAPVFRPVDSLLSGPAAGVAGAVAVGVEGGFERIISFDMGGTSTDVARADGHHDLADTHTVGGMTIARPAVAVETVAAGGGSICEVRDGRPAVGPMSAGASPGPACYQAGGPLTITDVNLLLGRIDAEAFEIPIDQEASQAAFEELADQLALAGHRVNDNDLLTGLLELTNETMAEAIRGVSIRRGYDPKDHAMVAFGGAGPQHACDVATLLGMSTVLIPRDASLLSAIGLHSAVADAALEREIYAPLDDDLQVIEQTLAQLAEGVVADLRNRVEGRIEVARTARMRFVGQDSAITVDASDPGRLGDVFIEAYKQMHGSAPSRSIEVVGVRVVARPMGGYSPSILRNSECTQQESARPQTRRVHDGQSWIEAPVHRRVNLTSVSAIEGPAMIDEPHTQTWIPAGWRCVVASSGTLRIDRTAQTAPNPKRAATFDCELIVYRLAAIAEQMGDSLERSAVSVNVKDRRDYSCGVLDTKGRLVSSAAHMPVHLGALGPCVRRVVETLGPLERGDAVVTNHPAFGGSHLPDLTVVQPVFDRSGERVGYVASRAHHAEIGGLTPGSMPPDAQSLADEGVPIRPMFLTRCDRFLENDIRGVLLGHRLPTRAVEDNITDLDAAVVAGRRACELIADLVDRSGRIAVDSAMHWINKHTEDLVKKRLATIEGLPVSVVETMDDGTEIHVALSRDGEGLVVDFKGTSPVHVVNINAPLAVTRSAVAYVVRLLLDYPLPLNDGLLDAIEVIVPPGCVLNPGFSENSDLGPPVAGGNVETSQRVVEALLRALRIGAGGPGTMNNLLLGNDRFSVYETICSGAPASDGHPGADAVHQHMTNTRITDIEVLEQRFPLRVQRFEIRKGSGGAGAFHGGRGVTREIKALERMTVTMLTQRRNAGPHGLAGGASGAPGSQRIIRPNGANQVLGWAETSALNPGDRLVIQTPGGGGFGNPTGDRDRADSIGVE